MNETAGTLLRRVDAAAHLGMKPVGGGKSRPATGAVLRLTEAVEAQRHAKAVLKEVQDKAELERLTASLIRQGKALPMQHRDIAGRLITTWIGSTRAFLDPFSEPLKKGNLEAARAERAAGEKRRRDQAAYAALAREERSTRGEA